MINGADENNDQSLFFEFDIETVVTDEFGNVIDQDEVYPWPDRQERVDFANDSAQDIVQRRNGRPVFDSGMYVGLSAGPGNTMRTSPDGIEWSERATTGFEGYGNDLRGLAASNGRFATVAWHPRDDNDSGLFVATSSDLADWTVEKLTLPDEISSSAYPIDVAITDDLVGVLVGIDGPDHAAFVFTGPIGTEPVGVSIPGEGAPASLVAVDGTFAAAVQVPGDDVPNTIVWRMTSDGSWEAATPLPDGLTGELHAVGDSLVVIGLPYADVEVFVAVSDDIGRSWTRIEITPEFGQVLAGPGGIVAMAGNGGFLYSKSGRSWDLVQDDRLTVDQNPDSFIEVHPVAVGQDELVVSRFEATGEDDLTQSTFSVDLP